MLKRQRKLAAWNDSVPSRDQQFELKRKAVLKEAARAFSSQGYHATSLDDVARVLGVTKPALYYYVKSKQEILFECHMLSQDLGDQAFDYANEHGRTSREILVLFGRHYLELLTGEIGACAVLSEFHALEPANRDIVAARRDKVQRKLTRLIERGIADGSVRNVDPKLTVFYFMGAVNWLTRWFNPGGSNSGDEVARVFADLLDHSIAAAPAHAADG